MRIKKYDANYSRRQFLEKTAKGVMTAGVLTSLWPVIAKSDVIKGVYAQAAPTVVNGSVYWGTGGSYFALDTSLARASNNKLIAFTLPVAASSSPPTSNGVRKNFLNDYFLWIMGALLVSGYSFLFFRERRAKFYTRD